MLEQAPVLLVIPTYNEALNLKRLIEEICAEHLALNILVIDDNSPDGTGRLADSLGQTTPRMSVLHRKGKLGIGSAHKEGFQWAIQRGYERILTMDADFSHSPRYLRSLLEGGSSEDVVIGSRYIQGGGLQGWSMVRRFLTHTAHGLTRSFLGISYDCTGGLRLYPVPVLKQVEFQDIRSDGYAFLIEMLFRLTRNGVNIREIPIVINSRHQGKSKISKREILKAVMTLLRLSGQQLLEPKKTARPIHARHAIPL